MKLRKGRMFPYLLIAPSVIVISMVLLVPLLYSIYCSLYTAKYMSFDQFVGLGNYIKIIQNSEYGMAFGRTFYISAVSLLISLVLGVLFALWTHRYRGVFAYAIQLLVLIPWVTSQVVSTMLWKWVLNEDTGLLNYLITGVGGSRVAFFSNKTTAVWVLIFVMAWRTIGYAMINILAGLKGIPASMEEAALIDGASGWQRFRFVRLPMIKTQLLISGIIIALSNINNLIVPMTLTGGGPGTATQVITLSIYKIGFSNFQFGISSALSVILFVVTVILSIIYVKALRYEI